MEKRLREKNMLICILVIVSIGEYAYAQLQPDTPLSMANASFIGMYPEASGWSVASAGDVNGDGYDDFLIGGLGKTYLILGRAASNWGTNYDLASSDASFISQVPGQQCGYSVASAGDVNGDGLDDFLIGAPFSNQTGVDSAGVTYLILGRAAANWGTNYDLASADASFIGEVNHDLSGWTVASAGDVDGDGFYDFLIGAHANQEGGPVVGQTYLILGRAAANWGTNFNLSGADASFIGEAVGDFSGWSVASAGDVDGDGYDDFLIGAFGNDDGGTAAGKTYLILGDVAAAGWVMDYDLALANASFIGEGAGDQSSWSVASAGDVNGDGLDDFLIGAFANGGQAGKTYLLLGEVIVAVEDETGAFISPDNFSLSQNYPNPFNPTTTITYQLPKTSQVDISIYNLTGQLVKTLVSEHKNAGYHSTEWNSSGVGSGVYFYRIEAGEYTETKKCLILK